MWKKILLSVIVLVIVLIGGALLINFRKNHKMEENINDIVQNETELSTRYVSDDCLNEWSDYSKTIQAELKEANQNLNDENRHYIIRTEDNFINIYYINEKEEEILYRVTDISTKYLAEEDVKELEIGIHVYGVQELNKLLEDFE